MNTQPAASLSPPSPLAPLVKLYPQDMEARPNECVLDLTLALAPGAQGRVDLLERAICQLLDVL